MAGHAHFYATANVRAHGAQLDFDVPTSLRLYECSSS